MADCISHFAYPFILPTMTSDMHVGAAPETIQPSNSRTIKEPGKSTNVLDANSNRSCDLCFSFVRMVIRERGRWAYVEEKGPVSRSMEGWEGFAAL